LEEKAASGIMITLLLIGIVNAFLNVSSVKGWSNGGYSTNPSNPNYGTHDWIAQHALDWLPNEEKQYILDNLATYLYGTELPDNNQAPDGIGDVAWHHVYFSSNGTIIDDWGAFRAQWECDRALFFLDSGDLVNATKTAGIMSHYLADVAVFGHVMAADTPWGAEVHHSDYESYVVARTSSYSASEFNSHLSFDGDLTLTSAYNATKNLAYDTTFDVDGDLTCVWMDQNYNWGNPTFKNRCGESLNLAVNLLADVLHTLYTQSTLGENITVFPAADVGVLFENVTEEGSTTVNKTGTGPETPPMYVVKQYYNIETTANYSGNIMVKIIYDIDVDADFGLGRIVAPEEEKSLQLMQWNETTQQWEEVTTHIDMKNNLVVGETNHLSIFGVRCLLVHDIALKKVVPSKNIVGQGYNLFLDVTIINEGSYTETSTFTLYANITVIGSLTFNNLLSGTLAVFTFAWNTSGSVKGNYTISAVADTVPDESDTDDNGLVDGWVIVAIIGDVNGDKIVDVFDLIKVAIAFGSKPGDPSWNPNTDLKEDNLIDVFDLIRVAIHFGETTP